jgi:hypothetical protein
MVFLGLLLLFITIALWEGPALVKQRLWGELILFVVLLLLGAAYGFGLALDIPLPNPPGIGKVFRFKLLP